MDHCKIVYELSRNLLTDHRMERVKTEDKAQTSPIIECFSIFSK